MYFWLVGIMQFRIMKCEKMLRVYNEGKRKKGLRSEKDDHVCTLSWNKGQDPCSDSLFCMFRNLKGDDSTIMFLNMTG